MKYADAAHTQSLPKTVVANDALAQSQFIDKPVPPIYGEGYATNGFRQEHTSRRLWLNTHLRPNRPWRNAPKSGARRAGCEATAKPPARARARASKIKPQNCQIQVIGAGVGMHRRAKLGGNPREARPKGPQGGAPRRFGREICVCAASAYQIGRFEYLNKPTLVPDEPYF